MEDAKKYMGLSSKKFTILIIGGSQGADSINQHIINNYQKYIDNDIQIIWQTGKLFYTKAKHTTQNMTANGLVNVQGFIGDMAHAYSACDIIVSRAGAIAVSEICCVGKPTILVPSPYVAEDHQTQNAKALVEKSAAVLVNDHDTIDLLGKEVLRILSSIGLKEKLSDNLKQLAKPDATEQIVNEAIALMK